MRVVGLNQAGLRGAGHGFERVVQVDGTVGGSGQDLQRRVRKSISLRRAGLQRMHDWGIRTYWPVPADQETQWTGPV